MKGYGNPSTMRPKGGGDGGASNKNGPDHTGFKSGPTIASSPTPRSDFQGCCDALSGGAKGNVPEAERKSRR